MARSQASVLALSALAIVAVVGPASATAAKNVKPKYTVALSGVLTADHSEQSSEEVDTSRCKGTMSFSKSSHAGFAFSYKSGRKQALSLPKKGLDLTFRAQISNAVASTKTTRTSDVQPTPDGSAEDCAQYASGESETQCTPNKTFFLGVDPLAGSDRLTIQNDGEAPDDVFYIDDAEEGERYDCPAELGGFLKSHEIETRLRLKAIRKLKVGKSIKASGSVDHQRQYGEGTAVYGGNYKMTFKRVK
jgi:hypothetical protein